MKPTARFAVALALSMLALAGVPYARGQSNVSSALSGVITGEDGQALSGVAITLRNTSTGITRTAETGSSGRYTFSGLRVGDLFTVTAAAPGYRPSTTENLRTQLGVTVDANLTLQVQPTEVVTLEPVVVEASGADLDSSSTGAGSILERTDVERLPTVQRSFADLVRLNPFVDLRSILSERSQPVLSAVGQNNRFNSIQVDGARINDQFGLNGSGLQSFGNPISLEAIEQMNVSVSPYNTDQSGFTGASINAVTRSGTNEFHGSAYSIYTDQDLQDTDVFGTGIGTRSPLQQKTYGATLGGPLVRNRLFFFLNYEKFSSLTSDVATLDPTGTVQGSSDLTRVLARFRAINTATGKNFNFGQFPGRTTPLKQKDTKKLAKLDWNISPSQRLSVRYTRVKGDLPDSGKYSQTATLNPISSFGGFFVATPNIAGLDSNGFKQDRDEKVWAAQLFSTWTPFFRTEIDYSQNDYRQETPVNSTLPEIRIFGFSGLNRSGATVNGTGALVFGTEVNRQGNFVGVKTRSYRAQAEYDFPTLSFRGGYDREDSRFENLFRMGSYGVFDYANVTDFENDAVHLFARTTYLAGTPPDEKSRFAVNGIYAQARWTPSARFTGMLGLRYDWFTTGARPPLNAASNPQAATDFLGVFGFRNDGTVGGVHEWSPRLEFNLALDRRRVTQLRGGVGHFVGRIPWVMVSNSYGNSGVGRSAIVIPGYPLVTYLSGPVNPANPQLTFDPADPIGTTADPSVGRPIINLVRDGIRPPSVWRGNLAVDRRISFLDSTVTLEGVFSRASEALFMRDLNLKPLFTGSDGRQVFSGPPQLPSGALHPEFGSVYELSNIHMGSSAYISLSAHGGIGDRWKYSAAYTHGEARDALPLGEAVAAAQLSRNPVFNQNVPVLSRSAFEVRNRFQLSLTRYLNLWNEAKSTVTLYYEGRSGNPYSFTYANDANGDGISGNDLVYVPTGMNDPVIVASIANGMPASVAQQYIDFVNASALRRYAGGIAPRHGFIQPWVNRLDLHLAQEIPIYGPLRFEVFADFVNFGSWLSKRMFGYTDTIDGQGDSEVFTVANFGRATYLPSGQLVLIDSTYTPPAAPQPDNKQSRWRIQLGGRLTF